MHPTLTIQPGGGVVGGERRPQSGWAVAVCGGTEARACGPGCMGVHNALLCTGVMDDLCDQVLTSLFSLITHYSSLPTSYFRLPTSYFLHPTLYSLLPTSNFQLPTSNFLLPTSYSLLPTSYFLLPTSYFLLLTDAYILTSHFETLTSYFLLLTIRDWRTLARAALDHEHGLGDEERAHNPMLLPEELRAGVEDRNKSMEDAFTRVRRK